MFFLLISIFFSFEHSYAKSCIETIKTQNTVLVKRYESLFESERFKDLQDQFIAEALNDFSFYFNEETSQILLTELINSKRVQIILVDGELLEGPFIVAQKRGVTRATPNNYQAYEGSGLNIAQYSARLRDQLKNKDLSLADATAKALGTYTNWRRGEGTIRSGEARPSVTLDLQEGRRDSGQYSGRYGVWPKD